MSSTENAEGTREVEPGVRSPLTDRLFEHTLTWLGKMTQWPWYIQVGLLYVVSRLISFAILASVALQQDASPWGGAHPDYAHFINIWDSDWYHKVMTDGYPSTIPRDQNGLAKSNTWAFLPLFPLVVKGLSLITGLDWLVMGPLVALIFGLAAALMIYRLFRLVSGHSASIWGTALVFLFPASPVFQVPYAESMNLFFLAAALYMVITKAYLLAIPFTFLVALSRPVGVPFALMLGFYFLYRCFRYRVQPFPFSELWRLLVLGVAACAAALFWPVLAWIVTGEPSAYTDTEAAWRYQELVPVLPWFHRGVALFGPVIGWAFPVLLALVVYLLLTSRPARAMGPVLQWWCASYFIYIILFLNPQTSTFRLLIPMFPLALAVVLVSTSKAYRWSTAVMYVLMQVVWVYWLWRWSALPGGGDYPP